MGGFESGEFGAGHSPNEGNVAPPHPAGGHAFSAPDLHGAPAPSRLPEPPPLPQSDILAAATAPSSETAHQAEPDAPAADEAAGVDTWQGTLVSLAAAGDWTAWGKVPMLLLLLPISWLCLQPFVWAASVVLPFSSTTLALAYFAGVLSLLVPQVEDALSRIAFGARTPTPAEMVRLQPAWDGVLDRVAGNKRRFVLKVIDSDELNAVAAGAHVVGVTRSALELPDHELKAVLAHELGHHVGMHPVLGLITYWLVMPIGWAVRLGLWLARTAARISDAFDGGAAIFGYLIALVMLAGAKALELLALVTELIMRAFGRQAELMADTTAVRLGYGPSLLLAFDRFTEIAPDDGVRTVGERFAATHPTFDKRRANILAALEGQQPNNA